MSAESANNLAFAAIRGVLRTSTPQQAYAALCDAAMRDEHLDGAWVSVPDTMLQGFRLAGSATRPTASALGAAGLRRLLETFGTLQPFADLAGTPSGTTPAIVSDSLSDSRLGPRFSELDLTKCRSIIVLPMQLGADLYGAWGLWASQPAVFDAQAANALLNVATDVAFIVRRQIADAIASQSIDSISRREFEYRTLFENNPQPMWIFDARTLAFLAVNDAAIAAYGFTRDEFLQRTILDIRPPEDIPRLRGVAIASNPVLTDAGRWRHIRRDGSQIDVEVVVHGMTYQGKPAVFVNAKNVTEQLMAERKLAEHRDRLAQLSLSLVRAHENESRSIGRELHDQFGQLLTALKISLQTLPQLSPGLAARKLSDAVTLVDDLMGRVSRLSLELRPPMLDEFGLLPALRWLVSNYGSQTGIDVSLETRGIEDRRFHTEVEITAYRIVQETLTNIARHSHARTARLLVSAEANVLRLNIADDGVGFEVLTALAAHRGLSGMRERVRLIGGEFRIESAPGSGTHKTVELPLAPHELGTSTHD